MHTAIQKGKPLAVIMNSWILGSEGIEIEKKSDD